jgi:hypothetical protein
MFYSRFVYYCRNALEIIDWNGIWEHQRRHLGRCWAWEPRAADQGNAWFGDTITCWEGYTNRGADQMVEGRVQEDIHTMN